MIKMLKDKTHERISTETEAILKNQKLHILFLFFWLLPQIIKAFSYVYCFSIFSFDFVVWFDSLASLSTYLLFLWYLSFPLKKTEVKTYIANERSNEQKYSKNRKHREE